MIVATDDTDLSGALDACDELLALHLDEVVRRYGAVGLGVIDLPPLGPEPIVRAQVRAAAVLYFCREAERAGILPFVEKLAEAIVTGSLSLPIGGSARSLMAFWRTPEHRFTAAERNAIYDRVFDSVAFAGAFRDFAGALSELGRERRDLGVVNHQVRIGQLAQSVGRILSDRAVGVAAFAGRDIVGQIRRALAVLRDREIGAALGGGGPWRILRQWAPRLLQRSVNVVGHVTRAERGTEMIRWIADASPDVTAAARGIGRRHPLVRSAEAWLAAEVRV